MAEAQVGLRSSPVQLTLIVQAAPSGAVRTLGDVRWTRREGAGEGIQVLRLSVNTGYSLVVRGVRQLERGSRTWVRGVNGQFQEVLPDSSVTVARSQDGGGELEHPIQYRIESAAGGEPAQLPVTYELRLAPTL